MTKRTTSNSPVTERTAKRARLLIEDMLKEMQLGIADPTRREAEEWERLFGAKQSMVANLQKLVAALAALPEPPLAQGKAEVAYDLTEAEMKLLTAWLKETS